MSDLRYAIRSIARAPGFAAATILTLALGIGTVTMVFSLIDAVLMKPLPFPHADAIVQIETMRGGERGKISMREIDDLRERFQAAEAVAAYVPGSQYSLASHSAPEKASAILVSHDLLRVLGVPLLYGDSFPAAYDRERHNALVLSYGIWQRQFGGDPAVVGRSIVLDASPGLNPSYVIAGVMPNGFDFPARTDLYRSIFINPTFPDLVHREVRSAIGLARLKRGVSIEAARQQLAALSDRLAREFPVSNESVSFVLTPLAETISGSVRPYLIVLLAAVAIVMVMASVNVANLVLSRAIDRQSQLAIRRALGAGRAQLVRQLLVEGVVLAAAGGVLGLTFANIFLTTFAAMVKLDLPSWMTVSVDRRVLAFACAVSVLVGLASTLLPALRTTHTGDAEALRGTGRLSGGIRHRRLRRALLVGEVAISVLLLVCAGLMLQTFRALWRSDVGFAPGGLLTFKVALPVYYSAPQQRQFQRDLLARLATLPGGEGAALNTNLPFARLGQAERETVVVEGQDPTAAAKNPYVNDQRVGGPYFEVMGIPIEEGRAFGDDDREDGQLVAIVSRRFARQFWPRESAIGKRVQRPGGPSSPWFVVAGVAGDARHDSVAAPAGYDVYLPAAQLPQSWSHFIVRVTRGDPMAVADAARRAVWAINPMQPVNDVQSMQTRMLDTAWQQRASAYLLGAFALLAVTLASVGIYGVTSYSVGQRLREFGLRRALGAQRSDLLLGVLRDTGVSAGVGLAVGLPLAFAAAHAIRPLLFGVAPLDAITFAGVPLLLVLVSLGASLGPAYRAARIDPLTALRTD